MYVMFMSLARLCFACVVNKVASLRGAWSINGYSMYRTHTRAIGQHEDLGRM